ncbi:NAD(P)-binding protein [Xylaria bambusicola]|uniref:NAD(P)-binding protein n=1 Tax=Xylaria bambusicola TaxID=326684 RepID=UPI0020072471|nr:NAD(P)-binding protein [Xylaria bambusicola]KAI0517385.1 NAD(P)-binding protein [Xylaria bambusicola]
MASKLFAVIAGAGTGTGRAVALRFSKTYPVVLMARRPESYQDTLSEITQAGGKAVGVSADVTDTKSMESAFHTIKTELPDFKLAAAVYNVSSGYMIKPFLELKPEDLDDSLSGSARGLFNFAQKTMPLLLDAVPQSDYSPTLLVTGATSSIRGSAKFGTLAAGMFARRALAQSLAREFHPQGVHIAHAIIDGIIDVPRTSGYTGKGDVEDWKLKPEAIAESYWHLHTQPRTAFTQELDMRPYVEKF